MKEFLSLYVHMPWCVRKCPYCDFNSYPKPCSGIPEREYINKLLENLHAMSERYPLPGFDTVFLGGGTPSLFDPGNLNDLIDGIASVAGICADAEITIEANPGTCDYDRLRRLRTRFNRISFGVQSFNDRLLGRISRIHDGKTAMDCIRAARKAGFDNINLDLMYALPGEDLADCIEDIEKASDLGPDHISWYELTIEDDTAFGADPPSDLPDEDAKADMSEAGIAKLLQEGYRRYEISNYAREKKCRHNLAYWNFDDYLGIGAGAHSKITDRTNMKIVRMHQPESPRQFMQERDFFKNLQTVGNGDLIFQYFLNRGRLVDEVIGLDEISAATFVSRESLRRDIGKLIEEGYVAMLDENRFRISEKGFNYSNDMLLALLPD
ncbi:MAG: radical SAM family heme chaperone HemW [Succinivibrionaceae bacterium]|nr:radical SAM family heme chaperone HemW [Succinivibrionaceae bacterium]